MKMIFIIKEDDENKPDDDDNERDDDLSVINFLNIQNHFFLNFILFYFTGSCRKHYGDNKKNDYRS